MASYPSDLKYTKDHEWARLEADGTVRVGVTAYAVEQLGDVTLVDLPKVGTKLEEHGRFGDIESVKTVSELFSPIAGEVVAVNDALDGKPELVNEGPYDKGWMIAIKPAGGLDGLMDAAAYEAFLGTLDH
ncbi:glycine cleavage system protein GcvH [Sandaracinus amylolyticus]|uniref:Glycine cleavage system H protein n=1 Tax=Sandaracinus amylolyticus TaxID=927083 RepID=A0A0F6W5T5_9BACT|nr:glycine cleavage system protein GcvH [Sandaracinus amylolyticus]AKF08008.1 Glycine cleavage system H protein [Sandaracinus amylolyticus]